jgi:sulfonate transport system substrate-binding protein
MLGTAGLKESDVRLFSLEGDAMPAALARQEIDALAIWEPHAQKAADILGIDALILENPAVYRERFNLNTTVRVLHDPAKRRTLVSFVRAITAISTKLRSSPGGLVGKLANAIATPEPLITKVWGRFRFPAELDEHQLRSVLVPLELWAATISGRQARHEAMLAAIIDVSILAAARK